MKMTRIASNGTVAH